MIFSVNVCGSLAAIAVGFAYYMGAIIPPLHASRPIFTIYGHTLNCGHVVAISALVFLTWINIVGLRPAIILQNLATWAKFASIGAFLLLGFSLRPRTLVEFHWRAADTTLRSPYPLEWIRNRADRRVLGV